MALQLYFDLPQDPEVEVLLQIGELIREESTMLIIHSRDIRDRSARLLALTAERRRGLQRLFDEDYRHRIKHYPIHGFDAGSCR